MFGDMKIIDVVDVLSNQYSGSPVVLTPGVSGAITPFLHETGRWCRRSQFNFNLFRSWDGSDSKNSGVHGFTVDHVLFFVRCFSSIKVVKNSSWSRRQSP